MLTPFWTKFRPHKVQSLLWRCPTRYAAVVAGRGSGKTELARRRIVTFLGIKKPWPNPIYVYALPTYRQAERVAWTPIRNLIPDNWCIEGTSQAALTIKTKFGSTLYIVGMDKPHRIEGLQLDGIVCDESSDQKPGIYSKTIRPMLTERNAWCWRIGVPKRAGIGRVEFQAFFKSGQLYTLHDCKAVPGNRISSFWWESADILSKEEMEDAKEDSDPQTFKEQYQAHFLDMGGSIYHAYSKDNLSKDVQYDPTKQILVGCDFNVDPMCWILCQRHDGKVHVFDEVSLRNTNTEATLKYLANKYSYHDQGWRFFCDASSRARQPSASVSDYFQIKNFEALGNKKVMFPPRNPPKLDRFATVNAALCNAKGERRVLINPKCEKLTNDLSVMSYKENTTEPEKYDGTDIGHMADAFGYLCMRVIPLKLNRPGAPVVITSGNAA